MMNVRPLSWCRHQISLIRLQEEVYKYIALITLKYHYTFKSKIWKRKKVLLQILKHLQSLHKRHIKIDIVISNLSK